jgi:hypothetical protein
MERKKSLLLQEAKEYWLKEGTVYFEKAASTLLGGADEARVQDIKGKLGRLKRPIEEEGLAIYPIREGRKTIGLRVVRRGENGAAVDEYSKVVKRVIAMSRGFCSSAIRKIQIGHQLSLLPPETTTNLLVPFKDEMRKLIDQI